ncbi:G-type lectin S-receptor-like serine/threonine-protein kinase SD2-5 [Quercus robur]|uniref:G-type lectin S-receptor-like serine/threonine-protein kinase SD2-5 n=1 Tax=Quercus robur TaxID=38942 RepID=UPI002163D876|nr:G-type lectin S-receptor-like serine/threonine-protein kinase SD2-5 [Quercus robur]
MGMSWARRGVLLYLALFLIHFPFALPQDYAWYGDQTLFDLRTVQFRDGSTVRILPGREYSSQGPGFACGFFCNQSSDRYLLSIFILFYKSFEIQDTVGPLVVWSANQTNPVSINATARLSSDGGLVVQEADGTTVWTTNINSEYTPSLQLTDTGNLQLLSENDSTVWQSFDHPSDSLLLGQKLSVGQKLTSAASATYQIDKGLFSLSLDIDGLFAFWQSNEGSERYYYHDSFSTSYVQFMNGSLSFFTVDDKLIGHSKDFLIPSALSSWQYMRFESDGHLRVYEWKQQSLEWKEVADLLTADIGNCGYPTVCDGYSICTNGKCSCPEPKNDRRYFKQINDSQPGGGCSLVTPLSCEASLNQNFLELKNITSVTFRQDLVVDSESCKEACLKNCLCKAAIFQKHTWSSFVGDCYLPSQNFSLKHAEVNDSYTSTTYIKVQNVPRAVPSPEQKNHGKKFIIIVGSGVASLFGLFILIGIFFHLFWKNKDYDETEEYYLDHVPGMPTRYSFTDLQVMTENFKKNIGGGGFGTVFEGTLIDGTKVAVKRLHGINQIKKSFLAEVETIGSIHHFNLVKLIGFCAQSSHRLLVYLYMSNGSLDKWIFHKTDGFTLDWHKRKKIILDIAKGLTYLHEDCSKKIAHLDVKPENILLDENFNAKVADFGLSKLIDRDQSQVVTIMRGTPGYLAPEWLSSVITEKVDVYSFGVVLLEILCGRRHFDRSQPEEAMHLQGLFMEKLQKKQLLDLVDKYCEDMQLHGAEVVDMMRVSAWCLQSDYSRRPSMSMVVKVLEGVMDVEENIDYNFCNLPIPNTRARVMHPEVNVGGATTLLDSVLSGPR